MHNMEINEPAADFELPDLHGRFHSLWMYLGKIVVINFWSCECPHSERTDQSMLAMLAHWKNKVELLSIASNRNEKVEAVKSASMARNIPTVLLDSDSLIADLYKAQTTPHVYLIDEAGILRYRGGVDDTTFRKRTATRFFLDEAVQALLEGKLPAQAESPAYGCTIVREV